MSPAEETQRTLRNTGARKTKLMSLTETLIKPLLNAQHQKGREESMDLKPPEFEA